MNLHKNKSSFYEDAISKIDPNFFEEPIPEVDIFVSENENYGKDLIETSEVPEKIKTTNYKIDDKIINNTNEKKYKIIQNEGIDGKKGCCGGNISCHIF